MHPNMSSEVPGARREPRFVAVLGWFVLVLGLVSIAGLFGAGQQDPQGQISVAMIAMTFTGAGAFMLIYYRNWYLLILDDEMVMRTLTRRIERVRFDSVKSYSFVRSWRVVSLVVRGTNGNTVKMNKKIADHAAIVQKIKYFQAER